MCVPRKLDGDCGTSGTKSPLCTACSGTHLAFVEGGEGGRGEGGDRGLVGLGFQFGWVSCFEGCDLAIEGGAMRGEAIAVVNVRLCLVVTVLRVLPAMPLPPRSVTRALLHADRGVKRVKLKITVLVSLNAIRSDAE